MTFTIRSLFGITTFIAIYAAAFSQLGAFLTFLSVFFSWGLLVVASWIFGGPKYGDNEVLGWTVLLACLAIPVLLLACLANWR